MDAKQIETLLEKIKSYERSNNRPIRWQYTDSSYYGDKIDYLAQWVSNYHINNPIATSRDMIYISKDAIKNCTSKASTELYGMTNEEFAYEFGRLMGE